MRNIIFFVIFAFTVMSSSSILAAGPATFHNNDTPNVYVGLQLAYATLDYDKTWLTQISDFDSIKEVDNSAVTGRISAGYAFNPWLAGEIGYNYFSKVVFHGIKDTTTHRRRFLQETVDFFAKLNINTKARLKLYGKAGFAWVHRDKIGENDDLTRTQLIPAAGVGVTYSITPHLDADISYYYHFETKDFETTQLGAFGFIYKFY